MEVRLDGAGREAGRRKVLLLSLLLGGLGLLIVLERLHTYGEPCDWDLATYAVMGQELLHGRALYADLWDHKPPAIYLSFAAGVAVAGLGQGALFLVWIVPALATLAGAYRAGSAAGFGRWGGIWAAALWAVICTDLGIEANEANAEVFMNACLIWAFALLVREDHGPEWWRRSLLTGALLALASLYKPVAVASAGLLGAAHAALPPGGATGRRRALAQVAVLAGVGVLAWAALFAYFAAVGHFADFYDTLFTFNRHYAGSLRHNLRLGFTRLCLLPPWVYPLLPLLGAGLAGCCLDLFRRPRPWVLWLAFLVSAHCQTCLPGKFWSHYYQLWLAPAVVGAGWGVTVLGRRVGTRTFWLAPVPGVLCLAAIAWFEVPQYRLSADQCSAAKYGPYHLQARTMAQWLDSRLLAPGETFYQLGPHSELYFHTGRRPPSGMIACMPWMFQGPLSERFADRQLRQVRAQKTELLIVWRPLLFQMPPSFARILEGYEPAEDVLPEPLRVEYVLWVLRDSACARRLLARRAPAGS